MGKRKRSSKEKLRRKIRRLENRLQDSTSSSTEDEEYDRYYTRTPTPEERLITSDSDKSNDEVQIRSSIIVPEDPDKPTANDTEPREPIPSTSSAPPPPPSQDVLPAEILEALGDTVGKEEVLGPAIKDEISKRWGRILVEGMTKDTKGSIYKKTLIPENFCLSKAPQLNLEISAVINETVRNRDKLLEKSQNQLRLGIAGLANLATSLIDEDLSKVEMLKRMSEVSQIFLDLHYESTKTRRKLITSSLDKKFNTAVADVKRDSFLFGSNLGEKIRATKTAEKSGLQIKRKDFNPPSSHRQQGNWKGPPRNQSTRYSRPGGPKTRYTPHQGYPYQQGHPSQQNRRPQAASRATAADKADSRARKPQ